MTHSSMLLFGYDLAKLPYALLAYIILSIIGLIYGTSYINSINGVRGTVFAIGAAIVLIYTGIVWFGTSTPVVKTWPPRINTCPDYLTLAKWTTAKIVGNAGSITKGCVDMLGVSTVSSIKQTSVPAANFDPTTSNVFEYTSADLNGATQTKLTQICNRCQTLGITWEGVYDGDTCVGITTAAQKKAAIQKCLVSV